MRRSASLAIIGAVLAACTSGSGPSPPPPPAPTPPSQLEHLTAGSHLGTWISYETLPAATEAAAATRWQELLGAGLQVARVHLSWADLEPRPGEFDLAPLGRAMSQAAGLKVLLLIETIDSEGFSLPADLLDTTNPYRLAEGRRLDDPLIVDRFRQLLARVLPTLGGRVFAISIGNEPDNVYDDVSEQSLAGQQWTQSMAGFLSAVRPTIQAADRRIAVGMTLRQASVERGVQALGDLLAASDVAIFNYYCQNQLLFVKPASAIRRDLDLLVARAAGLPIVMQEVGCPAGGPNSTIGATPASQAAFFAELGRALTERPTIRASFAFQLIDWSAPLAATAAEPLRSQGLVALANRLEESLATIGLLNFGDGTAKSSWAVFLDAVAGLER